MEDDDDMATADISAAPAPQETGSLRKGTLHLWESLVIAVSSVAPAYSIATALGVLAAAVGVAGPAAIWVGFIPVTCIAVAFYYLNREDQDCGASYAWVGRALNPSLGFLSGWVVIIADIFFMSFAAPQCGQATLQLFNDWGIKDLGAISLSPDNQVAAVAIGVVWLSIVTFLIMVGIQLAAIFQTVLLVLEYFIVLAFALLGFFKGGGEPFSLSWFDPRTFGSLTALAGGVVIAVFFYWGWDTAANLNEESEDASENPGRAGLLGMVALLVLFIISSVSIQMVLTQKEIQDHGSTALTYFANKLVGPGWGSLAALALVSSTVAVLQTTLLPTARTAFSMGRDGVLGRVWAIVHPAWKTPWIGTLIFGIIAGLIAIVSQPLGALNAVITAGVTSIGLLVAFYYGLTGIACTVSYRHKLTRSVKDLFLVGIVPVFGAVTLYVLAIYLLYQDWTSTDKLALDASNGRFQVLVPVGVLVSGLIALVWSSLRRRYFHRSLESAASPMPSDARPTAG
jgi:amino acid transporter